MRQGDFLFLLLCATVLGLGCQDKTAHVVQHPAPPTQTGAPGSPSGKVRLTAGSPPEDGQWTMPAKDYASTRYSGLGEITTGNVKDLKLAWSFSTGFLGGHEAAPLVVGGTMYVV